MIVVYGLISFLVFTWLAGYSLLHASIGNLVLIVLVLAIDEYMIKAFQSEKLIMRIKMENDPEKTYRSLQSGLNIAGSFKADLYLFYVIVLIFSQIIDFDPALVNENFGNFISANNYSILFLIAIDMLIGQYSKDRARLKKISEKFKEAFTKNQE
jgi:hypothetical protein